MQISDVNVEARKNLDMRPGDTVRVSQKIVDKDGKQRIQVFEGLVLARKHGAEPGATFTVRRVSGGYGVEKIFPLFSPMVDKIEIVKRSKVRRSKLYYIRETALKQIRKRMKMFFVNIKEEEKETPAEETPTENPEETPEETPTETKTEESPSETQEEKVEENK